MADGQQRPRPDAPGPDAAAQPTDATQPTDAQQPADATGTEPSDAPDLPTEQHLAQIAEDATVRRAPKIGAFITAGALLGIVLGFVLALIFANADPGALAAEQGQAFISAFEGEGAIRFISAVAGGCLGALVGAGAAVWADRRSRRG